MTTAPAEQTPAAPPAAPPAVPPAAPPAPPAAAPVVPPTPTSDVDPEARYYVIQDSGDSEPWALVAVKPRGLYEMWTGDEWVDMPFFATYFVGGDVGAKGIEPDEVEGYKASVRRPSAGAVAMMRGDGKGVAQPESTPPPTDEDPDAETPPDDPEAEADPAGEAPPAGDDPEPEPGDDPEKPAADDEKKPFGGKPKKGVNPFPKEG